MLITVSIDRYPQSNHYGTMNILVDMRLFHITITVYGYIAMFFYHSFIATVSLGVSLICGSERAARCLPRPVHHIFLSNVWGIAILKKLNTDMSIAFLSV